MVFHGRKGPAVNFTVKQLADLVQGTVQGDGTIVIAAARPLNVAQPGDITFVADDKHAVLLHQTRASAAVVPSSVPMNGMPLIRVADPLDAFVIIVRHLRGEAEEKPHGIDPLASIHPSATVGEGASIHAFASVGEGSVIGARCRLHAGAAIGRHCQLGDDVVIYPNAVVYDGTLIGDRVILHANCVIGADGFGFRTQGGKHVKVPQFGHVEIGDDVEVGACTTVDRGTFEPTRIGSGTKIDNLVQVGHNCQIGKHNLFVSQMGIAGSCTTGDYVVVAGQVGIADHIHIGSGAVIGAKAGVTKEVPAGQRMLGAPATPEREQKRILMTLEKLPEMRKDLRRILQHLGLENE
jgi:UDP-3-O-[3-hydroxymyristoyl] glucosamine N-acyltransferase